MLELKIKAKEISKAIVKEVGDSGSCVMGCEIKVDGETFIPQPVQVASTCYKVYNAVKEMLIENGVSESRIIIDHGIMD